MLGGEVIKIPCPATRMDIGLQGRSFYVVSAILNGLRAKKALVIQFLKVALLSLALQSSLGQLQFSQHRLLPMDACLLYKQAA